MAAIYLGAAKAALDLLRNSDDTLTKGQIAKAVADVQSELLEAQATIANLREDLAIANKQLIEAEDWKKIEPCYQLFEPLRDTNSWVCVFDVEKGKTVGIDRPRHYVCPNCFNAKKLSILVTNPDNGYNVSCINCKLDVQVKPYASSPQINFNGFPGNSEYM